MKSVSMITIFLILSSFLFAQGQDRAVSMEDIMRIAKEHTSAIWKEETLYPAEAMALYGLDNKINAWEINFSVKGEFPDLEILKNSLSSDLNISSNAGFGINDYAYIIMGATHDMPVIIESSQSLSPNIMKAKVIEQEARKFFQDDFRIVRSYYLGTSQIWTMVTNGKENIYINPLPFPVKLSEVDFHKKLNDGVYFWDKEEFDEEWDLVWDTIPDRSVNDVLIPGLDKMPFIPWAYGCSPTAAAMILAWWDNYAGAGKMSAYQFTRYDPVLDAVRPHTTNLVRILAHEMGTNYNETGGTFIGNIADGIDEAAEVWGYSCNTGSMWAHHHSTESLFNRLKNVIDSGIPGLANIDDNTHSVTIVGYRQGFDSWLAYDSNWPTMRLLHRSQLCGVYWPVIEVTNQSYLKLQQPKGSISWGTFNPAEVLISGYPYEIIWTPHSQPNTHLEIWYHIEGGSHLPETWEVVTSNATNNGTFNWMVPDIVSSTGSTSEMCRVRLRLIDSSTNELLAEDGSFGNFIITDNGLSLPWTQAYSQIIERDVSFAGLEYDPEANWQVLGLKSNLGQLNMELYDDINYTNMVKQSQYQDRTNYILINRQESPAQDMGFKFRILDGVYADYSAEGFTPKIIQTETLYNKTHPANKVVDIYEVYLSENTWYFDFGSSSLNFALFEAEGQGYYAYNEAKAWSRERSYGPKSFACNISTAGWYALVVNSTVLGSHNYKVEIKDQVSWTGAVSTDWFDAANWTSPIAPTEHYDVSISASALHQPLISGGVLANAKTLYIEAGATVTISSGVLSVSEDIHIEGNMVINSPNARSQVTCNGTVNISPNATLIATDDSRFNCKNDWSSSPGSHVMFAQNSELKLGSYHHSIIFNGSTDFNVVNLVISNYSGGSVTLHGLATGEINVLGSLEIHAGSTLYSETDGVLAVTNVVNNGIFQMQKGNLKLVGGFGIFPNNAGDYFHNVEIATTGVITLSRDLTINGDILISSGSLSPGANSIYIKGDWTNNGMFVKGSSNVIFNGTEAQYCYGDFFNILTIQNDVHFVENSTTIIDHYHGYSGALHLNGGTVQIMDLSTPFIAGKYVVNDGEIIIIQTSGSINMNADVTIHGGEMRVWGTHSTSYWAQDGNARLTMTGGVLDFGTSGINIPNSPNTLELAIDGGLIRTAGNFRCLRPGVHQGSGIIELSGTADTNFSVHPQSSINNLLINKQDRSGNDVYVENDEERTTYNSRVFITTNSSISGNLLHQNGELLIGDATFNVEGEAEIIGKLVLSQASSKFIVKRTLYWKNDGSSRLYVGTIEMQNGLDLASTSVFQMGPNANLRFFGISSAPGESSDIDGSINYSRIQNDAVGTRFGNLIIDKVDWTDFQIVGSQMLTVLGNMTIMGQSGVTLDSINMNVNGNMNNGSTLKLVNNTSLEVNGNVVNSLGYTYIGGNSSLGCLGNFDHQLGTEMEIDTNGCLRLSRPYVGTYYSLAGYVAIYETACLEVHHNGLQIASDNILLEGGTIKVGWAFKAMNANTFDGGTGRVELTGARAGDIQLHSTNSFNDLVINKPGLAYATYLSSQVQVERDLIIQGGVLAPMNNLIRILRDVKIEGGRLSMPNSGDLMHVGRNWINQAGSSAFEEGNGTVQFIDTGNYNSVINSDNFHNLTIAKAVGYHAELPEGATIGVKGNLNIAFRKLILSPASTLKMNNNANLIVGSSGQLYAVGTPSEPVTITADNGFYSFQTTSGSQLSAQYCVFEKMNAEGINLALGSIVDTNYPFSYCTFRDGASGGSLLKKYNTQGLVVEEAVFPANTWSGDYNVYHAPGEGHLIFRTATGEFSGTAYENDPDDNIIWTFYSNNPYWAHSPVPGNNETGVEPATNIRWTYTAHQNFANPNGFIVKMGSDPSMNTYSETYVSGGPGTYTITPMIAPSAGNTYYWQVIPTTELQARRGELTLENNSLTRGPATNCPIWSFSVSETLVNSFPYYQDFEIGPGGWFGGLITGGMGRPKSRPILTIQR